MAMRDAGVLGAALMAGTGIGVFPSLSAAAKTFVAVDRIFEPDQAQSERHQTGYEKYKMLYQQLVPWHS
jgi:sugar (pentulose or hexulose) kinase